MLESQKDVLRKCGKQSLSKRDCLVGFVPIQTANLSLEEVELTKHTYVGIASPARCCETEDPDDYGIYIVQRGVGNGENRGDGSQQKFKEYLQEIWLICGTRTDRY
jgi:hypothetical protein